ncbi:MAG: dipicolinate synthase subunit DpsA [Clostridia bacterium]|nr:dipicolinate synthase subunit DpsA [Clostridia bacterium]
MDTPAKNLKFAVVGGDLRQIYSAIELADSGYEVALYGFDEFNGDIGLCTRCKNLSDALNNSDIVILPMPVSNDSVNLFLPMSDKKISLSELFDGIDKKTIVFGGRTECISKDFGIDIIDYFEREELVVANAYLTAESAVGIAMGELKESIKDVSVLVMGYGRIGKALCNLLKGMGVNVYASARKRRDFAWIRAYGYSPVDTSKVCDIVSSCKVIFNTIPELVLGEETLGCIRNDSIIIDLASKPGGVDFEAAKKCGLKVLWALALPGKKLPVSAGRAQARTILDILEDMEVM